MRPSAAVLRPARALMQISSADLPRPPIRRAETRGGRCISHPEHLAACLRGVANCSKRATSKTRQHHLLSYLPEVADEAVEGMWCAGQHSQVSARGLFKSLREWPVEVATRLVAPVGSPAASEPRIPLGRTTYARESRRNYFGAASLLYSHQASALVDLLFEGLPRPNRTVYTIFATPRSGCAQGQAASSKIPAAFT